MKETVIKHPQEAEAERFWNFPYDALEEAVINAVYHRSYEIREPIEVRITSEELSVLSFPGPDRSVRMSDLRQGKAVSRRYRNRRIGEFLKELDLTEGRATGIAKILRSMATNGSPEPEFETDADRTYFLTRLPMHPERSLYGGSDRDLGTKSALSRHQVEVLHKCLEPRAIKELMEWAGRADRTKFRNQVIRPLLDANLVEMTIPDKPQSQNQRYRTTEEGKKRIGLEP